MTDFLVKRDDLRECRIAESRAPELGPGQALLRVDTFGLTANNVTYAVFGEAMSYWDFFPAEDGWGRVPMWGFAEVERSEAEGVEAGHAGLRVPAALLAPGGDAGRRRRARASSTARRTGRRCPPPTTATWRPAPTPSTGPTPRTIQMLLRPLFFTSFLIDDQLDDEGLATRGPIVISSASSKTAIAAAFLLAQRDGVELVGLTSPRSAEFVEGLGIYDRTVTYDAIDSLGGGPATFVDIAGDGDGAPRGPLPLRRRARLQHGGGGDPLGGARRRRGRAARADAGLLLRSRPGRQALRGLGPRRPRDDASPTPGTRSASGRRLAGADPRRRASTPCGTPTSTCSRAASTRSTPTSSRSGRGTSFFPVVSGL